MKANKFSPRQDVLFHPLVVVTIFVYIVNNLWLQRLWPSLLTGKLSDFTWLFFAPIIVCSLLGTILPLDRAKRRHIDLMVWGGIGIGFVLVKINPAANQVVTNTLKRLLGIPIVIVVDPTDILAIIALIVSFYFSREDRLHLRRASLSRIFVAVSAATLLTLADAAAEDYGISCIEVDGNKVIASSAYTDYVSEDGGETWQEYDSDGRCWGDRIEDGTTMEVGDATLKVRFGPNQQVLVSTDGGNHWQVEYNPEPSTQAQQAYYRKFRAGTPMFREGPFGAVIDPNSGNVVFAMGHEGVLLRRPNRVREWVAVGPYARIDYQNPHLYSLLWGEGLLAIASGLLVLVTLGKKTIPRDSGWRRVGELALLVTAWMLLGIAVFVFSPALSWGYAAMVSGAVTIAVTLIIVGLAIPMLMYLGNNLEAGRGIVPYVIAGAVFFLFPYLLWFVNVWFDYYVASVVAFGSQIILVILGHGKLRTA